MLNRRVLWAVVVLLLVSTGSALAEYRQENDVTLSASVASDTLDTSALGQSGELTFGLQEDLHGTVADTTGAEVDHSYVWVEVNGTRVVALDPPAAMYSDRK